MQFDELLNELWNMSVRLLESENYEEGNRLYELWKDLSKNGIYN